MNRTKFIKDLTDNQLESIFKKSNLKFYYPQNEFGEIFPAVRKEEDYFMINTLDIFKENLVEKLTDKLSKMSGFKYPLGPYMEEAASKIYLMNDFLIYEMFSSQEDEKTNTELSHNLQDYLSNLHGQTYIDALNEFTNTVCDGKTIDEL